MQKYMLFLFLIVNPFGICAMEDNSSSFFSSWRSRLPAWLVVINQTPLSPIQEVQVNKNNFEMKLKEKKWCIQKHILDYDESALLGLLGGSHAFLNKCKEAEIDGYSAFGAALIQKKVDIKDLRKFIQRLMDFGFKLTEKDRVLVALGLYNTFTAEQKKMMILLLQDHQEGDLSLLPHDVRRLIVNCIIMYPLQDELICSLLG